ncbi:MAG: adenosine deaminase [Acidimicrobiia bacterium]|nr:adenosine deaminase [Acidimicrobiia bacterium]
MTGFIEQLPKAELHLHLEGSLEPETVRELAPELSLEEIRARYRYENFLGFLQAFQWVVERLRSPEGYALAARRLLERLAAQNVRYAEITLSAGVTLWRGQEFAPVYEAVRREAARSTVQVWWVLDAVRQFGAEKAMEVARLAAERAADGVVAFGIGGDEAAAPPEMFAEVFAFARSRGLRLAPHAGETAGPPSIWGALRFGADRIGHGIRAVEDPALMRHLRDQKIPLEVCISSNLATGVVTRLEEHPARKLYESGVPIVLNTDDPAMFHTSLVREYELAARLGFCERELEEVAGNGFRFGFRAKP